jgi:DNA-binding MarR family transcriptional regulator
MSPRKTSLAPAPVAAHPVDVVEQQLLLFLRRARSGFDQVAKEVHPDLDIAAYGILCLIEGDEATTVTALAERMLVGKPTVSRQVTSLEKLGLVTREPAGPGGRTVTLRLTGEGRVRLNSARARRQHQFRMLLSDWTDDDVHTLGDLLARLNQLVPVSGASS